MKPCEEFMSMSTILLSYLITYSIVQSPSWETNWFATSQEIPRTSRNPKVHYSTYKRPPLDSILGQPNPVHIPTSHLLQFYPNIIHTSMPRSPQWSPSLRFPRQDPIHYPLLTQTRHMPSPSHSSRFYHPHTYWVRSTNHLAPRYAISSIPPLPRPSQVQIFSSTPYFQTRSASFPPAMSETKFHTHIKQQAKL